MHCFIHFASFKDTANSEYKEYRASASKVFWGVQKIILDVHDFASLIYTLKVNMSCNNVPPIETDVNKDHINSSFSLDDILIWIKPVMT